MGKMKIKDMDDELKLWFVRYFKYLESTDSNFFCENIGILEHCARDRINYQWEDRVIANLEIIERRYPDLYEKTLRHLLSWIEKIQKAKSKEMDKNTIIFLENYR